MPSSVFLAVPLMIVLTVLQTAVLPRFPIVGAIVLLPFLAALSWGLLRGADEGVIWAFIAGLFMDLFSVAPLGGASLTYMIAVWLIVLIKEPLPSNRFVLPMVLAAVATLLQQILYFLFLRVFGYGTTWAAMPPLLPTIILHALFVLPLYWFLNGLERLLWPRVVEQL